MRINRSQSKSQFTVLHVRRLLQNTTFRRNFITLSLILLSIFLIFSVTIISMFKNEVDQEYIITSQSRLNESAQAIDSHISEVRFTIAYLENDNMVRAFLFHSDPEFIYPNLFDQIKTMTNASIRSLSFVDSIYFYSYSSNSVFSSDEAAPQDGFSDNGWIDSIDKSNRDFQVFFRRKNNTFPYLLTIAKCIRSGNLYGAIVINIDLRDLSTLTNLNSNTQSIYLVSNIGKILYSASQSHLDEQVQTITELATFSPTKFTTATLIRNRNIPFTCAQTPSSSYPWHYVLVTHLPAYNNTLTSSITVIFVIALALILIGSLLAFLLSMRTLRPINDLLSLLENPENAYSYELLDNQEIHDISSKILSYIHANQALTDELSSKLILLNEAKILALQTQINPHFLFNTLNMIYIGETDALGYTHPVPGMTIQLSRLLRYAIESTDLVALSTELEFTKLYASLMQQRYNNKPRIIYDISDDALQISIPKLTIQPIVENAVFHGLSKEMNDNSTITISCHVKNNMCILVVEDNGVGMSPAVLQALQDSLMESVPVKNNIGLKNIVTRMQLIYGEDFSLNIHSQPCSGSKFTLSFPAYNAQVNTSIEI